MPAIKVTQESGRPCIEAPEAKFGLREDLEIEAQSLARHILKKQSLTQEEIEAFRLLFIQEALNQLDTDGFLVTENLTLLRHRIEIEKMFSTAPLNISTLDEMGEFLDLTFKYNSIYLSSPHIEVSENLWYWYSFRLKISHYNVDLRPRERATLGEVLSNSMMDGFSQRAGFLLSALDEMGFQYYSGVDNNTQAGMVYHFNYFILLMTGIFDSLALQAMDKYQLTFDCSLIPSRISLNTDAGRDYLRTLEEKNQKLRQHIRDNCDLVKAPYLLRELVVHREGLRSIQVQDSGGWKANLVRVPHDFIECLQRLGDTNNTHVQLSDFGVYGGFLLSPYFFSKKIAGLMFPFCDRFLELMGCPNFVEKQPKGSPLSFADMLDRFKEDNLGF